MDPVPLRTEFDKIKSSLPEIGLSELEKHDGRNMNNRLWTVLYRDIVCDITSWSTIHPGGSSVIKLIAGRESTQLIESYHHYNVYNRVQNKLNNLKIVGIFKPNKINNKLPIIRNYPLCGKNKFYNTLCHRVDKYLLSNNIPYYGYDELFTIADCLLSASFFLIFFIASYYHYNYNLEYFFVFLSGILAVRCGFAMHIANHRCFRYKLFNDIVGRFMYLLGMDNNLWVIKHNLLHHVAPNILGIDNDIGGINIFKMHPAESSKKTASYYKYQHIYFCLATCISGLNWCFSEITFGFKLLANKYKITKKPHNIYINYNNWNVISWILCKIWFFMYLVFLKRFFVSESSASSTILVGIAYCITASWGLIGTFSLNHIQKDLFAGSDMHWAELNILNSSNWSSGSKLFNWISGGLNHQIEHHLFPSMHPQNYPLISHIVRKTAKEYGLEYRDQGNCFQAFRNVLYYLKDMGDN